SRAREAVGPTICVSDMARRVRCRLPTHCAVLRANQTRSSRAELRSSEPRALLPVRFGFWRGQRNFNGPNLDRCPRSATVVEVTLPAGLEEARRILDLNGVP